MLWEGSPPDLCLCPDSSAMWKGKAGLQGIGLGETVPTTEVTDDDDVDWGSRRSHGDKGTGPRTAEKGWT